MGMGLDHLAEMSTGVTCSQALIDRFDKWKLGKDEAKAMTLICTIGEKEVDVTDEIPAASVEGKSFEEQYAAVKDKLSDDDCKYILTNFYFTDKNGSKAEKVVLIKWSPDTAKIKKKMMYAGTLQAVTTACTGIHKTIEASDFDEASYAEILSEFQ